MKRNHSFWLTAAVLAVTAGVMVAPSFAGDGHDHDKKMKEVTVEGILIDSKCYGMNPDNWAANHMTPKGEMSNCAQACANMGIPVGVLEGGKPGGDVYLLVTPSIALADHMASAIPDFVSKAPAVCQPGFSATAGGDPIRGHPCPRKETTSKSAAL
jgi:hypothetical protein